MLSSITDSSTGKITVLLIKAPPHHLSVCQGSFLWLRSLQQTVWQRVAESINIHIHTVIMMEAF